MIDNLISLITPIDLFNQEQLSKLNRSRGSNPMKQIGDLVNSNMSNVNATIKQHGAAADINSFGEYFSGRKYGELSASISHDTMRMRSMARIGTAAAVGLWAGSNLLLGKDSSTASAMNTAFKFAGHVGVGYTLAKMNPLAGIAYGGLGMINMFRKGDNIGPY